MPKSPFEDAARAEDLGDLLQHIAWTDTLRPTLLRTRDAYSKLLVAATLGKPIEERSAGGSVCQITVEQLAGRIYGLDFMLDLVERVLSKGISAVTELRGAGINLAQREI